MSPKVFRRWAGLLSLWLSVPALPISAPFPTYSPGENKTAGTGPTYEHPLENPWVVSDGAIITPAGIQVYLGVTTRAKAVAVNPTGNHTAAVLQMGAPQAVTIFNTQSGVILQTYSVPYEDAKGATGYDADGSTTGITYSPDGKYLLFSQDGHKGPASFVSIARVDANTGLLSNRAQVRVPVDVDAQGHLTEVICDSKSPGATTGSFDIPCGFPYSIVVEQKYSSYPMGLAVSADAKTAYAVLDTNDTLTRIDLTAATPVQGPEVRVGNVPHSVVISPDGRTAYVSNEAGRIANPDDFQGNSNGTPVVAEYPTGATAAGTVSVVDLPTFTVTGSISVGHHPTGMAIWAGKLLVANTYDDSLSVIDMNSNQVVRTIDLGLPVGIPRERHAAYGAGPNSIAVDAANHLAYVALYHANAIAVIDLDSSSAGPRVSWRRSVVGMIPVGYAPASVVLDTADHALIVANDKGIGTTGFGTKPPPTNTAENSYAKDFGVTAFNTHEDLGTVSIVPLPGRPALVALTQQVFKNNHWDLAQNIWSAAGGTQASRPAALPARIGDSSKIKHVFVIIRENRTYDQILGDVPGGNGDATLAVFGDHSTFAQYPVVTPNAHALVERFPLLDNFYDPSRQSADGHNWILQAIAPHDDDIQSPDWLRDYPANGGEAMAYQTKGNLFDGAAAAGIRMKIYGEYIEYNTFTVPGCTPSHQTLANTYNGTVPPTTLPFVVSDSCEPSWTDFYNDTLLYEAGKEPQLRYFDAIRSFSSLPNVMKHAVQNYPQFDLGIPDQYRVDVWAQDFAIDVEKDSVPKLEFIWISSDHTGGPPDATAMQADNDLAVGRFVDIISHSPVWPSSAIFVEEDDAQTGVDHVDGHRSPGYVISPYVRQRVNPDGTGAGVSADSTFYTQVNMTRTIEQILGLKPMNQNDLVASPMHTLFLDDPPRENFLPWVHVPNGVPLSYGVPGYVAPASLGQGAGSPPPKVPPQSPAVKALQAAWLRKKADLFAGKYHLPDAENTDLVSHYDWYEATGFRVPFPGEKKVRPPGDFGDAASAPDDD